CGTGPTPRGGAVRGRKPRRTGEHLSPACAGVARRLRAGGEVAVVFAPQAAPPAAAVSGRGRPVPSLLVPALIFSLDGTSTGSPYPKRMMRSSRKSPMRPIQWLTRPVLFPVALAGAPPETVTVVGTIKDVRRAERRIDYYRQADLGGSGRAMVMDSVRI